MCNSHTPVDLDAMFAACGNQPIGEHLMSRQDQEDTHLGAAREPGCASDSQAPGLFRRIQGPIH
eukprot:9735555-Karenia_brevis.AAC.1